MSSTSSSSTRSSSSALPSWRFFFNEARQQQVRIVPRCRSASPSSLKQQHHHHHHEGAVAIAGGRRSSSRSNNTTMTVLCNPRCRAASPSSLKQHQHHHHHHHGGAVVIAGGKRSRSNTSMAVLCNPSDEASCASAKRVAILWFKKDLRLDDHPGLSSTSAYHTLLPVYVFDPYLLRGWSNNLLEALVEAVADLKFALQGLGSDLIVRRGSIKHELRALAEEVHASAIITEEEIEHEWREVVSSLSDSNLQADVHSFQMLNLECWKAPMYDVKCKQLPSSYREFQRMRCPIKPPLQAPTSLPALPKVLEKGYVPSVSAIEDDVRVMLEIDIWHRKLKDLQTDGAEALLKMEEEEKRATSSSKSQETGGGMLEGFNTWRERYILASPYEALDKKREELAMYSNGKEVIESHGVGAASAMATLDAYLRFLEPTWRTDWKKVNDAVMDAESRGPRGASFRTLFGNALTLGTLSRRRVYHEAFEYEKSRNGGWPSPFGFSTFTAAAAVQEVKAAEWYRMLAAASEEDSRKKGWRVRTWCWRGFLIQYNTMGGHGFPIVLVHGYGAFWEHYRDNIQDLAEEGNRVWALTLLGFGRSEKPDVVYTELLWAELIRDFIVEVVGEPAILVGNSIGGYMVSMVSGLWPQIVKSLILLNTAGMIVPDYLSFSYLKPSRRTGVTWAGAQLFLMYLRSASGQILKKCYCVNPSRADDWLAGEMLRASHDPGAAIVLESFLCLKKPFPINWFIDRYKGKVYVIQGIKDPLINNTQRIKLFKSHCSNSVIQLLNAGHCPHDEVPDEVNKLIVDWLQQPHLVQDGPFPLSQVVQSV